MTTNKDFKRLVRARMSKTRESYTTARAHILRKHSKTTPSNTAAPRAVPRAAHPKDLAILAGVKNEAIKAKTGCTWERWVKALDHQGAAQMSHRDIATLVNTKYKIDGWWSQTVAVGYERIKGLRARGQQRNGTYEMTKSRTFSVPVEMLFDAWADARIRRRWMPGANVKVRTAKLAKTMRLDWTDGGIIAVGFTAKGPSKSAVAVAHTKLPDRETAAQLKHDWAQRLDALGALLSRRH